MAMLFSAVLSTSCFLRGKYNQQGSNPEQKDMRKRNCTMCTLSQNGYGDTTKPPHQYLIKASTCQWGRHCQG